MLKQAVQRSDAIITDSQFSKEELCKFLAVPEKRIQVIYPGVNFDFFSQKVSEDALNAIRNRFSLPSCFFLFVGNVKPHKNIKLILDAYEQGASEIPLVVLGKKEGFRRIDPILQRIENTPKLKALVHFVGQVSDAHLPAFYQMAEALLFPSFYEGFGLPPLEAMAARCPTIASSRASLPEICGQAAHFIDPASWQNLGEAMRLVAKDRSYREALRDKGEKQARLFSWENTAHEYRKVFQEIHFG